MSNKARYVVIALVVAGIASGFGYSQYLKSRPHPADVPATASGAPSSGKALGEAEMAMGNKDAKVTIIEYASMTCPHCAHFNTEDLPRLKENYIDTGKVRYIFREFPLDGLALAAAMVARCAGPDRYFAFVDLMYRNQKAWITEHPKEDLFALVKTAGMGQAQFDACSSDKDLSTAIVQTMKDGQGLYSVDSTPTVIVNGKKVEKHDYDSLVAAIKEAGVN